MNTPENNPNTPPPPSPSSGSTGEGEGGGPQRPNGLSGGGSSDKKRSDGGSAAPKRPTLANKKQAEKGQPKRPEKTNKGKDSGQRKAASASQAGKTAGRSAAEIGAKSGAKGVSKKVGRAADYGQEAVEGAKAAKRGDAVGAADAGVRIAAKGTADYFLPFLGGVAVSAVLDTKLGRMATRTTARIWILSIIIPFFAIMLAMVLLFNMLVGALGGAAATGAAVAQKVQECMSELEDSSAMGSGADVSVAPQGNQRVKDYVWDQMMAKGFTPEGAAAIMGNMQQESTINPNFHEQGGGGYGLIQWTGPRRTNLENYAQKKGVDVKTAELQMEFLFKEMKEFSHASQGNWFKWAQAVNDVEKGTLEFSRVYESPNPALANNGFRVKSAKDYYAKYRNRSGSNTTTLVSQEGNDSAATSMLSPNLPSYSKRVSPPLKKVVGKPTMYYARGKVHGGWDMGVPIGTPVYAVRDGVIGNVVDGNKNGNGGHGDDSNSVILWTRYNGKPAFVEYHHLSPGVKNFVKKGQRVAAGQQIAESGHTGNSASPHLDIRAGYGHPTTTFSLWGMTRSPVIFSPGKMWKGKQRAPLRDGKNLGTMAPSGPVFVVGDSLTVGSKSAIMKAYEGKGVEVFINAHGSKSLTRGSAGGVGGPSGLSILKSSAQAKAAKTWVVALGTNDAGSVTRAQFRKSVRQVLRLAGERNVYWLTVVRPGMDADVNAALRAEAERHNNLRIVDFAASAKSARKNVFGKDGIHLLPSAYSWHANMFVIPDDYVGQDSTMGGDMGAGTVSAECQEILQEAGIGVPGQMGEVGPEGCPETIDPKFVRDGISAARAKKICREATLSSPNYAAALAVQYAYTHLGSAYACHSGRMLPNKFDTTTLITRAYYEGAGLTKFRKSESSKSMVKPKPRPYLQSVASGDMRPGDIVVYSKTGTNGEKRNGRIVMALGNGFSIDAGTCGGKGVQVARLANTMPGFEMYGVYRVIPEKAGGFSSLGMPGMSAACVTSRKMDLQHLQPKAAAVMRCAYAYFPTVKTIGGWRASDPYPDHPSGRAVDVMVNDYGKTTPMGLALGDRIARYFQINAKRYGIQYMIWKQRVWREGRDSPTLPISQWKLMGDRGSITANHFDHVHITVDYGPAIMNPAFNLGRVNLTGTAWPVPNHRAGSEAGMRFHPILHIMRCHEGTDIGAPSGAPVLAFKGGRVKKSGWSGGYGNVVEIDHGGGWVSRYGHLSERNVNKGQFVSTGEMIGKVGSTGLSTGPHLHFETRRNDIPYQPMAFFGKGKPGPLAECGFK